MEVICYCGLLWINNIYIKKTFWIVYFENLKLELLVFKSVSDIRLCENDIKQQLIQTVMLVAMNANLHHLQKINF